MLGKKIRELRTETGLTLKGLGEMLNLGESTMSMYENGKRSPDYNTLSKIAQIFNVSTDYLLGRTDIKNNDIEEQAKYIESIKLETPEDAMKFILSQPSLMAYGGYDLNKMSEEEIMDLADDLLFAMKISLEKRKKK